MMVGHLEVPTIEPQKGLPSSLSRKVVSGLLVNDLGFQGACLYRCPCHERGIGQ
ncbi:hypothetical protein NXX09_12070 [Bacteroides uniformis]|nr:hypothetical protein [Bacteroides uniformis]